MNWFKPIRVVFYYTFVEYLKSKVLFSTVFIGCTLLLVSYIASEFSFSSPAKIALDFGLGMLNLSIVGIAIFMGATLISKEIESRNLYMILSRPVKRWVFLLGRYLGLLGILGVNTLILSFWSLAVFLLLGGKLSFLIPWSILFIFIEGALVLTIILFFSLVTNNILAIMSTISLYFIGHSVEFAKKSSLVKNVNWLAEFIDFYSRYFPNFTKFNIKSFVLYEGQLENLYLYSSFLYGVLYCSFFIFVSCLIFNRKELV